MPNRQTISKGGRVTGLTCEVGYIPYTLHLNNRIHTGHILVSLRQSCINLTFQGLGDDYHE